MNVRRWWATLAVLLWMTALLAPATSALAMEGERARLTYTERQEQEDTDRNDLSLLGTVGQVGLGLKRTTFDVASFGEEIAEIRLKNPNARISPWLVLSKLFAGSFNSSVPLLPDEVEGWASAAGQAGEGFVDLVRHYKKALEMAKGMSETAGLSKNWGRLGVLGGALRFGVKNMWKFGEFASALKPSELGKALFKFNNNNIITMAGRWLGVIGAAAAAVQGTLTIIGAIRDRGRDPLARGIQGVGGALTIVGGVATAVAVVAAAPAVAAGATVLAVGAGIFGAVLSREKTAEKLAGAARSVGRGIANVGRAAVNAVGARIRSVGNAVGARIRSVGNAVGARIRSVGNGLGRVANGIGQLSSTAGHALRQHAKERLNKLRQGVAGVVAAVRNPGQTVRGWAAAVANPRRTLDQAADSLRNRVRSRVRDTSHGLQNAVSSFLGSLGMGKNKGKDSGGADRDPHSAPSSSRP